MKIVDVIPLAKNAFSENLTYFTAKDISIGSVVTVPLRKKMIDAIVVGEDDLGETKSLVKSSDFRLRKIGEIKGPSLLPEEFWRAIVKTKKYFAATTGAALYSLLPKVFFESYASLRPFGKSRREACLSGRQAGKASGLKQEKLALQLPLEDRLSYYKTIIREAFSKKSSIFFCLPTRGDLDLFYENLAKGIEEFVFTFHGDLGKKEFTKNYNNLISMDHPKVIFGTPNFLFLMTIFKEFSQIILEKESSGAYRTFSRPFIDQRYFAEALSAETRAKIIFADTFLRMGTLYRVEQGEITEFIPLSFRLQNSVKKELIDLKAGSGALADSALAPTAKEERKPSFALASKGKKEFSVLSEPLKKIIGEVKSSKKRMFLFTLRKGIAGITICNDCHTILLCDHCSAPMVLYGTESQSRVFVCNKCKARKQPETKCEYCQSWNLVPLGIGVERVLEELKKGLGTDTTNVGHANKKGFKGIKIFKMDKQSVKTPAAALQIIQDFYKAPGAILIGTEMALFYLNKKIDYSAVVSFDSLFSIPSFSINEKIIHLISALEEFTNKKIIIQSRNPDEPILQAISGGNLSIFYRDELTLRKKLFYPPFSIIIKITRQGSKESVKKDRERLALIFKEYDPSILLGFIPKIKKLYVLNAILKIDRESWVDERLLAKLLGLPGIFSIQVDAEDLL